MKKILFVVDERKAGGVSKVLESIFENISNLKADILVLHNNGDKLENIKNANIIYGPSFFDTCDLSFKSLVKQVKIIKIIKKMYLIFLMKTGLVKYAIKSKRKKMNLEKYDIEISFKNGFDTYFVAHGNSKKKVIWLHNDYGMNNPGKHYEKSYTNAIKMFDTVVAIGKIIKENFNDKYGMESKTIVIPNIINMPITTSVSNEKTNDFEMICVGRLSLVKRYDMLIDIVYKLNSNNLFDNCVLKIIGDGEERVILEKKINDLNLKEKVLLLGNQNEPWRYANNSDLFVMCSKYEARPLTVVESQLVGIPVISVNFSSVKELIDEKNGFIVDNNFDALYNGIEKIIKNRNLLEERKNNLKNYKYDNDKIIKKIIKLFDL